MGGTNGAGYEGLVRADRVHRRVYTDPEIFDAEMRRIYGGTWVFVGHESEVPSAGDYKTDTLAGQPVVMTRDKEGRVHVFYNRCTHRGSLVCRLPSGNAKTLRCPYHGWTFGSDGRLTGVPIREAFGEDFDPNEFGLASPARVDSYRGFVFASLTPEVPELREHLGRVAGYLDLMTERAPDAALHAQKPLRYRFPGNWKLQLDNVENYHAAFLHKSAFEVGIKFLKEKYGEEAFSATRARDDRSVEWAFKGGHGVCDLAGMRDPIWQEAYKNEEYVAALARRHGEEGARRLAEADVHIVIYPNLFLHTRMSHYRVIKPLSVGETEISTYPCTLAGAPEAINRAIVRLTSHHVSPGGEVQVDDLEGMARCQQGLAAEAVEWVLVKMQGKDEHADEHGDLTSRGASELLLRGYYEAWRGLMSGDARPCSPFRGRSAP